MNSILMVAVATILSATLLSGSADAAGCLKGAVWGALPVITPAIMVCSAQVPVVLSESTIRISLFARK